MNLLFALAAGCLSQALAQLNLDSAKWGLLTGILPIKNQAPLLDPLKVTNAGLLNLPAIKSPIGQRPSGQNMKPAGQIPNLSSLKNPLDSVGSISNQNNLLNFLKVPLVPDMSVIPDIQAPGSQFDIVKFAQIGLGSIPPPVGPQLEVLKPVSDGLINELFAVKDSIDKTITFVGSSQFGLKPSSIHLIGHGLGAHISSFAGKTFHRLTGRKVGRISGQDPAGPCFTTVDDSLKLNHTDADFVDVIHTDDGVCGLNEQLGHLDFYPNGGTAPPGYLLQTCSHNRAWQLFAEPVLRRQTFPAVRCSSWGSFRNQNCNFTDVSVMGYACSPDSRGVYYLQTATRAPFGRGVEGLKYYNNDGILKNVGSLVTVV